MKKISNLLFAIFAILLCSCTEDLGTTEVTYIRADAKYGDLEGLRSTPLISESKDIDDPGKVYVSESLLLIGEEEQGIHVFDNSNPESPNPLYFINIPNNREFYVSDNIIYAESLYDMIKIDITNQQSPSIVSRANNAFAQPVLNNNGEALIGFDYQEVTEELDKSSNIWSLLNDNDPIFFDYQQRLIPKSSVPASFAGSSGSSIGTVNRIAHTQGHVYVISNSIIYTFKDDTQLEKINESAIGWDMETIYPRGNALFIGTRNSMEILSIADKGNPTFLSSFFHATSCDPVLPTEETAYVTLRSGTECNGTVDGLNVIDIRDLNNPVAKQEILMESPYGMTLIGDQLYVGEGSNGLKIFEVQEDDTLELIEHDPSIEAYDVIPHPTNPAIILVASPDGFGQYEISNNNKTLLSFIST